MNTFIELSIETPINAFQREIIDYPNKVNYIDKTIAYIRENPISYKILIPSALDEYRFMKTYALGIVLGLELSPIFLNHLAVYGIAWGAAGIAGLIIFESVVIAKNINKIIHSNAFKQWELQYNKMMKDKNLVNFIEKDCFLRHLVCPITGHIPLIPAKIEGTTYEFAAARNWILSNPGKPLPGTQTTCEIDDLTFDYPHLNTIVERFNALRTAVKAENVKKFSLFLGVKNPDNSPGFELFMSTINLLNDNGYPTPTLFKTFPALSASVEQLTSIHEKITFERQPREELRQAKLAETAINITDGLVNLLHDKDEFEIYKRRLESLIQRASNVKAVYIERRSNFIDFFCNIFDIKPNGILVDRYNEKLNNDELILTGLNIHKFRENARKYLENIGNN